MPPARVAARVAVVGAGLSGAACAQVLRERGVAVDVYERGRAPGGRMASPELHGRRVDLGAAYFTAKEPEFAAVVDGWVAAGIARPWTDTFDVFSPSGHDRTTGPVRFAAPGGLRSLVRDVTGQVELDVRFGAEVTALADLDHDAVVLAMPDPQAARLAPDAATWVDYEPVLSLAAGWPERVWPLSDAAFVNDDPDLSFLADDGARRGDRAAVLVAHSTAERARAHLAEPDSATAPMLAAVRRVLGITADPQWSYVHRWTFAKPSDTHGDSAFGLLDHGGRPLGLCGDAWCPSGAPRVESAWLSGRRLGAALADGFGS
jgi:renalase